MGEEENKVTIDILDYGKCALRGEAVSLFTNLKVQEKIKLIIVNRSQYAVRHVRFLVAGPSEGLSSNETKTYGVIKAKKEKISTFTILSKKVDNFTLYISLQADYKHLATFPIKVFVISSLSKEAIRDYKSAPMESCTLSVYSKSDVKLFFEGGENLSFLSALSYCPKKFYIIIRNRSANILRDVGVRLYCPPKISSSADRKYEDIDKNQEKHYFFTITPKETGNFTLNVKLDVLSLQISEKFPLEIRVSNAEYIKKILENKKLVSKQEQKEHEIQIEIEKQQEKKKQLEKEKKKKKEEREKRKEQKKKLEIEKKKKKKEKKKKEKKKRKKKNKKKKKKKKKKEKEKRLKKKKQLEIEKKKKEKERELKEKKKREKENEKRKKEKEEKERQDIEQLYPNLLEKISNLNSIYDEIRITDIEKKLPEEIKRICRTLLKKDLITLIEEMILNADINARIRGDYLIFINKDLIVKSKQQKFQPIKDILISRGGDWKIENKQSVFNYKVKVKNDSKFMLTNIQILLTSIPSGLISQSDKYVIDALNPDSFESPTFKFSAKESCVGDKVKGVVIYTDPKGNPQTVPIQPFKIKYVCNLLIPKPITEENYERNIPSMHEQKITFDCKLSPDELEPEISKILQHNNFYLLENLQELKSPDFKKVKAYAEGKYDKQDVALSVIMQSLEGHTNKLIIKAMSNKEEKIIDLLRDINMKCDAYKSTPEDLASLEVKCKNCESLVIVTDNMKSKDFLICEDCGEEIKNLP